jgi:chitinase
VIATPDNRKGFIANLVVFLLRCGFKDVDIDWEYSGDKNRGSNAADGANLIELVKEMRQALG